DLTFPASIPFTNTGTVQGDGNLTVNNDFILAGTIQGNGSLTVNGNTTWNSGTLDRTFTNQATRIMDIATSNGKTLNAPFVNEGTLNWIDGQIVQHVSVGGSFTNNATMTISSNALYQDNNGNGPFNNTGTITKTSTGTTSISNMIFTNSGTVKGVGTIALTNGGSFTNTGFIAPGLSPGILALNNRQLFSASSTLSIEVASDSGPGIGHDQLQSDMNPLTINGTLSVALLNGFVPEAGNQYSVLTYPSATDTFSTEPPCWIVTYSATNTSITFNPAVFNICADNIAANNDAGLCSQVVNYIVEALGSPEPTLTYTFGGATTGSGDGTGSGSSFNVGVTNVIILADNGCSGASCAFTITIMDVEIPIVDCPDDITQSNDPGDCSAAVELEATATDNCDIATIEYNPPSGSDFPVGTTMITVTATDVNGNSGTCTFSVTVIDTEDPAIDCPDDLTVNSEVGTCEAVVNYNVTFDDNCEGEELMQTAGLASGSAFPIGTTTNIFLVTDAAGNTTTCSFTITVNDTELPTIDCPVDITTNNDPGVCGAVAIFDVAFDDNCLGEMLTQTTGLPSGSVFPVGTTVNTFVAIDASGNTSSCSVSVTVNDTEVPVIDCPDDLTVDNDPGECGAVVNYNVLSDDNCPEEMVEQTAGLASGNMFPVGSTTNTFVVTDGAGNSSSCSFVVTVIDAEIPLVDCPEDITALPEEEVMFDVSFSDNCPGVELEQTAGLPSGSVFPPGVTVNSFIATDAVDSTSTCSFTVTVVTGDTVIICPPDVTVSTEIGECNTVVFDIDPTVIPDDLAYTYSLTGATTGDGDGSASGLSFEVGITVVTYTSTDNPVYNCDFTVTVITPPEICNGIDDDCDGLIDDDDPDVTGQSTWYEDTDGDGYGDPGSTQLACEAPSGYVSNDQDCDDTNADVNPDASEVCNDIDDDCDGLIDDDDPDVTGQSTWYEDADSDDFGNPDVSVLACDQPNGYVANDDDCDDTDPNVNPNAPEVCNGVDDDCDGLIDDDDPDVTGQSTWYADTDGDGYGDPGSTQLACDAPAGYVANDDDCDDMDENINPDGIEVCNETDDNCNGLTDENAAQEVCNGVDDDCDGLIDDEDPDVTGQSTWYADTDGDGYGDPGSTQLACDVPVGYVSNDEDCDDTDENIHPGATEICNGEDDDCDGSTDEGVLITWYQDSDGDGYGKPGVTQMACTQPEGYVANNTDCNDNNAAIHPGATEMCNGVDDDCDGSTDEGCPPGDVSISIDDTTMVMESEGVVKVRVRLSGPSDQTITVSFKTVNGTAKNLLDYRSRTGILTFQPGQTLKTIRVTIIVDGIAEPDEYFLIKLFNPQNAPILNAIGVVIITESEMGLSSSSGTEQYDVSGWIHGLSPDPKKTFQLSQDVTSAWHAPGVLVPNPQTKYASLLVLGLPMETFDVLLTDMHGRVVADLRNYENDWSMSALSGGMYLYRIVHKTSTGSEVVNTGKLIITD
ncbi:MAG TPA: HYR domain-containing protein, partial [Saprospiraceae bacterium]|nr:HYR domain-containing protein [Saprospiraceae bacterium]